MKLLTLVVPCYNSQAYMRRCVDSLLPGGSAVEVLIVNDGSTDKTGDVADEYAARYPDIVRVLHQQNKGHGGAINAGLKAATGLYFKVVDSDDWLAPAAYAQMLQTLAQLASTDAPPDLVLANFVYEKEGKRRKKVMSYAGVLPQGRVFGWSEVGGFAKGQYLLMHSVIYRTALLRQSGLTLPEHTFYVDNLFVYIPLPCVQSLYYLDADLYRYYIGREDQSVNEQVMISRIDQQIKVNRQMIDAVRLQDVPNPRLRSYMFNYLEIVTAVSSVLLLRSGTPENMNKKRALWAYIRQKDPWLHYRLRRGLLGTLLNLPGTVGKNITLLVYKVTQKAVGFS